LTKIKRSTWALVEPNAQVGQFEDQVLTLAFTTSGLAGAFGRADHAENLRQAIHKTIGIDCQIHAVAGGAKSAASSEPNPKVPASRNEPATSADAAWGLTPDTLQTAPSPAPRQEAPSPDTLQTAPSPAQRHEAPSPAAREEAQAVPRGAQGTTPTAASSPVPAKSTSAAAAEDGLAQQPSAREPGPVASAALHVSRDESDTDARGARPAAPEAAELSGSYAYPDDDWGPPRDEDAPPLDEEPPMDWVPSASSQPASSGPMPAEPSVAPAPAAARPRTAPASAAEPNAAAPSSPTGPAPAPVDDPWSRAVEQSPGVWTVGSNSNVGVSSPAVNELPPEPEPEREPEPPRYAPAAAQIPQYAAAGSVASAAPASDPDGWGAPQLVPVGAAPADRASLAAADIAPITAPSTPVAAPQRPIPAPDSAVHTAQESAGRLSLYQRLSNSPEAEAGRAKAPARAASPATYVQDVPSADDETIEESGVFGRAAVERILGGKLVEERSLDGTPLAPRF
jgi:DNA polymerase-3 subunit gamma/tau